MIPLSADRNESMYPLRFHPQFQRYIWGGTRLAQFLDKPSGPEPAAESWEIVDYRDHQSEVAYGSFEGRTLGSLLREFGRELVGARVWQAINRAEVPESLKGRFPLLLKFLDADQALSVQVHPDDQYGSQMSPADLGKTEAWYVLHAQPGARIYSGLKPGVTRERFAAAVAAGESIEMMHSFEPQVGDTVFIPAGTMHALGAGLVIAEIQQTSNTTFRVYDWDRVDQTGKSRPLHIEQALDVTRFERGPVEPVRTFSNWQQEYQRETLVECDKFKLARHQCTIAGRKVALGDTDQFRILVVTKGGLNVPGDLSGKPLSFGQTMLLPAAVGLVTVESQVDKTEFLEITPGDW